MATVITGRDRLCHLGRSFLLCLLESVKTEGIPHLAELRGRRGGPLSDPSTETEGILNLAELRGGQHARPLDQVVPGQGGQPRARGKAWTREHEPQQAFKKQSFHGAYCDFDAQAADADVR